MPDAPKKPALRGALSSRHIRALPGSAGASRHRRPDDKLTANPIAEVMNRLGFWTLFFLLTSLAASPMKALFGWTFQMRVRRMVGLFAFFYASLHFTTYLALDQAFDLGDIGRDIVKRKFITVGFAALLLLVPLAVTSTDGWVKRLGFRRWKNIHRLAYAAACWASSTSSGG